ncbi:protein kinase [Myxococcota bacterium]|nr:protein kinase [Myxococcota bacterium]
MELGELFAGRFKIERLIGEGGIGRVYKALDTRSQAWVAIKCLRPEYSDDPRVRRRFLREARAVSRLNHPNIVQLYHYGEDDKEQLPYIAMELVNGAPLSALRDQGLTTPQIIHVTDQLLSALAYSHARGIVHRDVKPENVIIEGALTDALTAVAKLLDFGFARVEDDLEPEGGEEGAPLTRANGGFGTPLYMAPEQASTKDEIGPQADLYAIGIILFEYLTGRPPFTGPHGMAVALKHLTEPVPNMVARPGVEISPGMERLVRRALEKSPVERFSSAASMRHALAELGEVPLDHPLSQLKADAAPRPRVLEREREATASLNIFDPIVELESQPLIGRAPDQARLWDVVREVCVQKMPRLVLLSGASGMGRQPLIRWLHDQVNEGGWMYALGGDFTLIDARFTDLRQAVNALFGGLPQDLGEAEARINQLTRHWADGEVALNGVGPLLGWLRPGEGAAPARGNALFALINDALRLAARRRPLLLFLNLSGQLSRETLRFIHYMWLGMRRDPFPLLIVASWLSQGHGLPMDKAAEVLGQMKRLGAINHLLSPIPSEALAEALMGTARLVPEAARAVAERAEGNPFFAKQLLHLFHDQGSLKIRDGQAHLAAEVVWPQRLDELMRARVKTRLDTLPKGALLRELLTAASVLGRAFEYGLLVEYLSRLFEDKEHIEPGVEALLQAQLFIESTDAREERLGFFHEGLRKSLYEAIKPEARARLHLAAAEALEAWYGDASITLAETIGVHYERAGQRRQAARHFSVAAARARAEGLLAEASDYFQRGDQILAPVADAERQRAVLWLDLGELDVLQGDLERAQMLVGRVYSWAHQKQDLFLIGRALLLLGDIHQKRGQFDDARGSFHHAQKAFSDAGDHKGVARCLLGMAMLARRRGEAVEARVRFDEAKQAMSRLGDHLGVARAARAGAEVALAEGDYEVGVRLLKEAAARFEEALDVGAAARCAWLLAEATRMTPRHAEALPYFEEARKGYTRAGDSNGLGRVYISMAHYLQDEGRGKEAIRHYQAAISVLEVQGDEATAARLREEMGLLALDLRELDIAEQALRAALTWALKAKAPAHEALLQAALAEIAAERGDHSTCGEALAAAIKLMEAQATPPAPQMASHLEGIAAVDIEQGRLDRARDLIQRAALIYKAHKREADQRRLFEVVADLERGLH